MHIALLVLTLLVAACQAVPAAAVPGPLDGTPLAPLANLGGFGALAYVLWRGNQRAERHLARLMERADARQDAADKAATEQAAEIKALVREVATIVAANTEAMRHCERALDRLRTPGVSS